MVVGALLGCHRVSAPTRTTEPTRPTVVSQDAPGATSEAGVPSARARFTVGGRAVTVSLVPDRERFMVSEPVFARVVFEVDEGPVEVELSWMGRNSLGRAENYRLTFLDAQGRPRAVPDAGPQFGGTSSTQSLERGRAQRVRLLLQRYVSDLTPGRYTVRLETEVRARAPWVPPTRPPPPGQPIPAPPLPVPWETHQVLCQTDVEVVADDVAALGGVLDDLGRRALGQDYDDASQALGLLSTMQDPRVIPIWDRVAQYPDYSRRFAAVAALRRFDDPVALAALLRAANTTAAELPREGYATEALREQSAAALRHAAVHGLAESPSPAALQALLARRADPDREVRLSVLHRIARIPGAEALPMLQAFTRDADPTIQSEARRYLSERRR
jgi:hypothetical protein